MSEGGNAQIIPFLLEDDAGEGDQSDNPARRLHIAEAMRMAEAIVFASAEPVTEKALLARLPEGVDVPRRDERAAGRLREARRQSGQGRRRLGVPHGRRSRLPDEQGCRAAEEAVARRARSAGDHRLPPAGDARRDRGDPRRRDLQGHARHADGNGMGAHARPPPHAGPSGDLRHQRQFPRPFRAGGGPRPARASTS